ncbi:UNVERIFIED_CONTAM: hypothetical protein Slati_2672800 [Sesamum latifolium]|uniref:Uncharacterized protein n=1 Tax=Sesamum latifolium TaxID=2727402 RepID=A0AAW2VWV2_9LAMI
MITSAICEQLAVLVLVQATTPSEVVAPEEADPALAVPAPNNVESLNALLPTQAGDVLLNGWLGWNVYRRDCKTFNTK